MEPNSKKSSEFFINSFESFPLLDKWQDYLDEDISNASKFNLDEKNQAISLCLNLNSDNEITEWSFHLTFGKMLSNCWK